MATENDVSACPLCGTEFDTASFRPVLESCGHTTCRVCFIQSNQGCVLCTESFGSSLAFDAPVQNNCDSTSEPLGQDFRSDVVEPQLFPTNNLQVAKISPVLVDSFEERTEGCNQKEGNITTIFPAEIRRQRRTNAGNRNGVWKKQLCKPKRCELSPVEISPASSSSQPPVLEPVSDFSERADSDYYMSGRDTDDEDWTNTGAKRKKKLIGSKLKRKTTKRSRWREDSPPVLERMADSPEHPVAVPRASYNYEIFSKGLPLTSSSQDSWEVTPKKCGVKSRFPVVENLTAVVECVQTSLDDSPERELQADSTPSRIVHQSKRKRSEYSRRRKNVRQPQLNLRALRTRRAGSKPWQIAARKLTPCFVVLPRIKFPATPAPDIAAASVFKQSLPSSASRGRKSLLDRVRNDSENVSYVKTFVEPDGTTELKSIIEDVVTANVVETEDSVLPEGFVFKPIVTDGESSPSVLENEDYEVPETFVFKPILARCEISPTVTGNQDLEASDNFVLKPPLVSGTTDSITGGSENWRETEPDKNLNPSTLIQICPDVIYDQEEFKTDTTAISGFVGTVNTEVVQTFNASTIETHVSGERTESDQDHNEDKSNAARQEPETQQKPTKMLDSISVLEDEDKPFQCGLCSQKFKSKAHMKSHGFCQNREKPHKCKDCGQTFLTKYRYECHMRLHAGEFPHICPKCGKGFYESEELAVHLKFHSEENRYTCDQCGLEYQNAQELNLHVKIHMRESFACNLCKLQFPTKEYFVKHLTSHKEVQRHECSVCNKSFKTKRRLDSHLRIHFAPRAQACSMCTQVFLNPRDLRRHLAIHSEEKPFKCWICGTTFRRIDNLDRHIQTNHQQPKDVAKQFANQAAADYFAKQSENDSSPKEKIQNDEKSSEGVDPRKSFGNSLEDALLITGDVLPPESAVDKLEELSRQGTNAMNENVLEDNDVDYQDFNEDDNELPIICEVYSTNGYASDKEVPVNENLMSGIIPGTTRRDFDIVKQRAEARSTNNLYREVELPNANASHTDVRPEKRTRLYAKPNGASMTNRRGKQVVDKGTQCVPPESFLTSTGYVIKSEIIEIDCENDEPTGSAESSTNPEQRVPTTFQGGTAIDEYPSSAQYIIGTENREEITRLSASNSQGSNSNAYDSGIPSPPEDVTGVQYIHSPAYPMGRANVVSQVVSEESHYVYHTSNITHRTQHVAISEPTSTKESAVPQIMNASGQYHIAHSSGSPSNVQYIYPNPESTQNGPSGFQQGMQLFTPAVIKIGDGPNAEMIQVLIPQNRATHVPPTVHVQEIYNVNGTRQPYPRWQPLQIAQPRSQDPVHVTQNANSVVFGHQTVQHQEENTHTATSSSAPIHMVHNTKNTVRHQTVQFQQQIMQSTPSSSIQVTHNTVGTAGIQSMECYPKQITQIRPETSVRQIRIAESQARSQTIQSQQDQVQVVADPRTIVTQQPVPTLSPIAKAVNANGNLPRTAQDVALASKKEVSLHHNYATNNTMPPAAMQGYIRGAVREIRKDA